MAFKDEFGIWRRDVPSLEKYETIKCKRCGHEMENDLLSEDDEWDEEMEQDYPGLGEEPGEVLYAYQRCHAECHKCGRILTYGPRWYWNPNSGHYDLPRPLRYEDAQRAEAEADRKAQESAGQLTLF